MRPVYTYLFHNKVDGMTKIGKTKSPANRFHDLSKKRHLSPVAVFYGDTEKRMHFEYYDLAVGKEWFNLTHDLLEKFRNSEENLITYGARGQVVFPGPATYALSRNEPPFYYSMIDLSEDEFKRIDSIVLPVVWYKRRDKIRHLLMERVAEIEAAKLKTEEP